MTDGSRLRESWSSALKHAQNNFRSLLTTSSSPSWRRVAPVARETSGGSSPAGKGKGKALPQVSDVIVHRRATKSGDVVRLVLDIPAEDGLASLESWRAVLTTPEMRKEWDPTVEGAHVVEMFDPDTRISKTDFTLGWPANPRDAITISRVFTDANTLIDISTSLPRSPDEPGYLRPAPPYVRSQVHLFAWCLQLISTSESSGKPNIPQLRITCFWQQDFKAVWGAATLSLNLPSMIIGLIRAVRKRGDRIPMVAGWGAGVSLDNVSFTVDREALQVDYSILPDDEDSPASASEVVGDMRALKEKRRLERSAEFILPISQGWDIQMTTRASLEEIARSPWAVYATRVTSSPPESSSASPDVGALSEPTSEPSSNSPPAYDHIVFRIAHTKLQGHSVLKVKLIIELSGGTSGLRINGLPHTIQDAESRDPSSFSMPKQMLEDATSVSGISFQTTSTTGSGSSAAATRQVTQRKSGERSPAAEKSILTLVRRNYIYFTSLLQEPEAKWRHISEGRGVTISKLDTIDPTLVVYRAEAVFVGVGVWDLFSIIKTPGATVYWDKGFDDGVLLEDVNELSELWHVSQKAAWAVNARDAVLLTTSYKSPTAVHIFSFSAEDRHLFNSIPPPDVATIRTQVDLHGWSIEALSPTTTLLTLLDQSDPKGWSNKSSIPQQMIATMAGVGEFAIKCGGPPIATRLGGAKISEMKYDHERGTFKLEYEGSEARRATPAAEQGPVGLTPTASSTDLSQPATGLTSTSRVNVGLMPKIECELRCDIDTWASGLEMVIDPPPQSVSCLRRHRLTSGGGLWVTIEHDATFVGEEPLLATVRKMVGAKEKGVVLVNGSRVKVDVEDLPESEVKALTKQKRIKPVRIPLDQPPVLGVIRRRKAEWDEESEVDPSAGETKSNSSPMFSSPLTRFFTMAVEQTVSTTNAAAAVLTPATYATPPMSTTPSPPISEFPMQGALNALQYLRGQHSKSTHDGWTMASEKGGLSVTKKMESSISAIIPVHKAEKVIEGISAGEIALAVSNYDSRKAWDDRFSSYTELESYGNGCSTGFVVVKSGFPFRERGFWVSNIICKVSNSSPPLEVARDRRVGSDASLTAPSLPSESTAIFIASVSFNPSAAPSRFSSSKVNPTVFPTGQLLISGWILETVDPYQHEHNYAIPSTKCTRFVAVDYRGSVPVAFNTSMNAMLPRTEILGLEAWLKTKGAFYVGPGVRFPGQSLAIGPEDSSTNEDASASQNWTLRNEDEPLLLSTVFDPALKELKIKATLSLSSSDAVFSDTEDTSPTLPENRPLVDLPARMFSRSFSRSSTAPYGYPFNTFRREQSSGDVSIASASTFTPRRFSSTTPRLKRDHISNGSPVRRSTSRSLSTSTFFPPGEAPADSGNEGDVVVAELVVNPVLYRDAGYRINVSVTPREEGVKPTLGLGTPEPADGESYPFVAQIYTIPASPLLSTPTDKPISRHLVRLTLPVRQYYAQEIIDPLTGEVRKPPVKPEWLKGLETEGAVVTLTLSEAPGSTTARTDAVDCKAWMNGKELKVMNEKMSMKAIGREVLEDDRLWDLAFLSRSVSKDEELLPSALRVPAAVNTGLLEEPIALPSDIGVSPPLDVPAASSSTKVEVASPNTLDSTIVETPPPTSTQTTQGNGLLNFWNASANFLRIPALPAVTRPTTPQTVVDEPKDGEGSASTENATTGPTATPEPTSVLKDAENTQLVSVAAMDPTRRYRLSTLIIVAVIAFLCGSLLRSLLSPADFIYFTPGSEDSPIVGHTSKDGSSGWREVRRLFEVKYGLIGWDFVVAVVRRPLPPN